MIAPTSALLGATRAAILERKRGYENVLGTLGNIGSNYTAGAQSRTADLLQQAQAAREQLAFLQQNAATAPAAPGESGSRGFFTSKGFLIAAGVVAVLLLARR